MITKEISGAAVSAVSILFFAVVILCSVAVLPFIYVKSLNTDMDVGNNKINRLKLETRKLSTALKEDNKLADAKKKESSFLLNGETTGIVGANLQKLLTELVSRHRGQARTFQILPPEEENNLTRISISFSLQVDIKGLQNIIFAIETQSPLLFIDNVVIQSLNKNSGQINPLQGEKLDVSLRVSGFRSNTGVI